MNTANWIPDLFMKQVKANAEWYLFCPNKCSLLYKTCGDVFEDAYYDLWDYLMKGPGQELPGEKPSEKLNFALRWIAKFEQDPLA